MFVEKLNFAEKSHGSALTISRGWNLVTLYCRPAHLIALPTTGVRYSPLLK
jgi:hypothetical protein